MASGGRRALRNDIVVRHIDEPGFNDPFAGAKRCDVELPVTKSRCKPGVVIATAQRVNHRTKDWLASKIPNDRTLVGFGVSENVVLDRKASHSDARSPPRRTVSARRRIWA